VLGCLAHFGPVLGLTSVPNNPTNALGRANKGGQQHGFLALLMASYGRNIPWPTVGHRFSAFLGASYGHNIRWPTVGHRFLALLRASCGHNIRWPTVGHRVSAFLGASYGHNIRRPTVGHRFLASSYVTTFGGQPLAAVCWPSLGYRASM
jgi:hypothetical protein